VSAETLERITDFLMTGMMIAAMLAFVVIVRWTYLRPRERIETDAQLWKDDE
jgi:hypothetical protein